MFAKILLFTKLNYPKVSHGLYHECSSSRLTIKVSSQSRKSDIKSFVHMADIGTFTEPKNKMVPLSPWEP